MKKLNKLQINSEKLMKNEELTTLRGGYGGYGACDAHGTCSGTCLTVRQTPGQCKTQSGPPPLGGLCACVED